MEIGRKFLIPYLPKGYDAHSFHQIEQAYPCTGPVVRIRQEDDSFYLIYKDKGLLSRRKYNLPLTREACAHLFPKADGVVLTKKHYLIPLDGLDHLAIGLDIFEGRYAGLLLAEVEFTSEEETMVFQAPEWLGRDTTFTREYQDNGLACGK